MSFSPADRKVLLAVKGVGPTVISRIEQLGISTLGQLAQRTPDEICTRAAAIVGSTCWKNSPQARAAISAAITAARKLCIN